MRNGNGYGMGAVEDPYDDACGFPDGDGGGNGPSNSTTKPFGTDYAFPGRPDGGRAPLEQTGFGEGIDLSDEVAAPSEEEFDVFFRAYVESLLWTNEIDNGNVLDLTPSLREESERDCRDFLGANYAAVRDDLERAGADFWLTRNGHGAGFWDGAWPADVGRALTRAAKVYGSVYVCYDEETGRVSS